MLQRITLSLMGLVLMYGVCLLIVITHQGFDDLWMTALAIEGWFYGLFLLLLGMVFLVRKLRRRSM